MDWYCRICCWWLPPVYSCQFSVVWINQLWDETCHISIIYMTTLIVLQDYNIQTLFWQSSFCWGPEHRINHSCFRHWTPLLMLPNKTAAGPSYLRRRFRKQTKKPSSLRNHLTLCLDLSRISRFHHGKASCNSSPPKWSCSWWSFDPVKRLTIQSRVNHWCQLLCHQLSWVDHVPRHLWTSKQLDTWSVTRMPGHDHPSTSSRYLAMLDW